MKPKAPDTAATPAGDELLHELGADGVLHITINRAEKRNALSRALLAALGELFASYRDAKSLKVAVLTGAGDKSFAAGGDLRDLASIRTIAGAEEMCVNNKAALEAMRWFPVPVVGALNGDAIGGGSELAMACDFRVAASHARIGFIQPKLNITTAWGGAADLFSRVGPGKALDILCRADIYGPAEAQTLGLVDAVADADEPLAQAVERFIAPYLKQVPQILRTYKALVIAHRKGMSRAELDKLETRLLAENWVHEDHWAVADNLLK